MCHISCGDSNTKLVRDLRSAAEILQQVEVDLEKYERGYTFFGAELQNELENNAEARGSVRRDTS